MVAYKCHCSAPVIVHGSSVAPRGQMTFLAQQMCPRDTHETFFFVFLVSVVTMVTTILWGVGVFLELLLLPW